MNTTSRIALLSWGVALCVTPLRAQNVIPNPSFEEETVVANEDYATNVSPDFRTSGWRGGILTTGGKDKTFCPLNMADGMYGMALHVSYRSTSTEFDLSEDGLYVLKFCYAPRLMGEATYGMYVKVRFDNSPDDVIKVAPTVSSKWAECASLVKLSAGRHTITFEGELKPGVSDATTVIDAVSLEKYYEANLVPNASFEVGTDIPGEDYVTNVNPDFHTSRWQGGILTCGGSGLVFCDAEMYDGKFGMALHPSYRSTELDFAVPCEGRFRFSFAAVSRKVGPAIDCKNTVTAYIDDEPIISLLPDSTATWKKCSTKIVLKEGMHHLKFVGVAPSGIDASTVIDGVVLQALETKGLVVEVR